MLYNRIISNVRLILFLSVFLLNLNFAATEFDLGPYSEQAMFFLPNITVTVNSIDVKSIDSIGGSCTLTKQEERSTTLTLQSLTSGTEQKTLKSSETIELDAIDPINHAIVGTFKFNVKDIAATAETANCIIKNKKVAFKVRFDALNFCSDDDGKNKEASGNASIGQITPSRKTTILETGKETDSIILVRSIPLLKSFDTCLSNDTISESFCQGGTKKIAVLNCDVGFTCKYDQCVATAAVICEDSDEEILTTQGSVRYGVHDNITTVKDECIDAKTVREYSCINKKRTALERSCPSNMQCTNGACVPEAPKPTVSLFCTETDNGKNDNIVGEVEWGAINSNNVIAQKTRKTDECISENKLLEYYCENNEGKNVEIKCENGNVCRDGKCVLQVDETKETKEQSTDVGINNNDIIILIVIIVIVLGAVYFYINKKKK